MRTRTKLAFIFAIYALAGAVEVEAGPQCNYYTYEYCSGMQLRAIARDQWRLRNESHFAQIKRHQERQEKWRMKQYRGIKRSYRSRLDRSPTVINNIIVQRNDGVWVQKRGER